MKTETFLIKNFSSEEKNQLLSILLNMAQKNLKSITQEYLEKRTNNYRIITLVYKQNSDELLAFAFSHTYFLSCFIVSIPVFHVGLTVVSKSFRGRHISSLIFLSMYDFVIKKNIIKKTLYFTGALFTAKCSTPVSFLKIKKSSSNMNWPRIHSENKLSNISYSWISKILSKKLSPLLSNQKTDDFILKNVNTENSFQLSKEEYSFRSKKDKIVVQFFRKNIIPNNELITIVWFHPFVIYFKRKTLLSHQTAP